MKVKNIFGLFIILVLLFTSSIHVAHAYTNIDVSQTSGYNLRILGYEASQYVGSEFSTFPIDVIGDTQPDLVIGAWGTNSNGNDAGSVFIIDNAKLPKTGPETDMSLSTVSNYSIRINGRAAAEELGEVITAGDFDGDGLTDLAIGSWADTNGSDSGAVYIILGSKLRQMSGVYSTTDSETYSLRIDGHAGEVLSYSRMVTADFDQDGKYDLIVGACCGNASNLYFFKGSLITSLLPLKSVKLNDVNTYTTKYSSTQTRLSYVGLLASDVDSDGKKDLLVAHYRDDTNGFTDNGSIYLLDNSLLANTIGTNNDFTITDNQRYTLRYIGPSNSFNLGVFHSGGVGDYDGDQQNDLILGTNTTDFNSRNDSGSLYFINRALFISNYETAVQNHSGQTIEIGNINNYSYRLDGPASLSYFGTNAYNKTFDINNDGFEETIIPSIGNSKVYILNPSIFQSFSGSKTIDMSNSNTYLFYIYLSNSVGQALSNRNEISFSDMNNDGMSDYLLSNYTSDYPSNDNGSYYIIFNFPHTIILDSLLSTQVSSSNLNVTGSVSAPNSVTTISGVQWSLDNDPQGSWTACTASDGAFDETSETYSCNVTGLADGARVVYTRAYDQNTSYTAASHYASVSFTVDTQGPTSAVEINAGSSTTNTPQVTLSLSAADVTTSVEYMMISNSSDFSDSSWEPYVTTKSWTLPEGSGVKTVYAKFKDTVGNVSPVYSDSITLDITTPDTVWTSSTGETRTFSFDSVGDSVVSSVSSDNLYTDDTLPTFSFTRAGDSTSGVNRYQVLLQREGSEGYSLYIDSIPPDKPGSGSDTSDKTREDENVYISYGDADKVQVRSKKESDRLTPGAYKFKVRVYDNAGNYQDSPEKILRVRSHSAVFSSPGGDVVFPLTLLMVGEKSNLNITSLDENSIPKSLSISSLTPTFYGIANSGATIYLELLKERFDPSINSTRKETFLKKETMVNGESRYGINLTPEDGLTPGSYFVHLMAQNDQKDYVELPEFTLNVGAYTSTFSPVLGVSDEDTGTTEEDTSQQPTKPPSRIHKPLSAPTLTPTPKNCILFDLVCW